MAKYVHIGQEKGVMKWQMWKCRKTTAQMLKEAIRGQYKVSVLTMVIIFLGVLYIISPIDLIPDRFWVIGWVDDVVVLFLVLKRLQIETQRYIRFKAAERRKGLN